MLVRPNAGLWAPRESPDGKFIYGIGVADNASLVRVPVAGGEEQTFLNLADTFDFAFAQGGIYFIPKRDPKSLQFLNTVTGKVQRIASFDTAPDALTVSPDGRWILYGKYEAGPTNLMLVENFH